MIASDVVRWADDHHFYLVPMVSANGGVCAIHGEGCKGKHPKYKLDTEWDIQREKLFLFETGKSHLLVLDIDSRAGGFESLTQLMTICGELNPQIIVRTGGGGYHYYYADWVRPSVFKSGSIMSGIDIKAGSNSFVVCPGMPHHAGNYYELIQDGIPHDPPEKLAAFILKSLKGSREVKDGANTTIEAVKRNYHQGKVLFDLVDIKKFAVTGQGWRGPHPVHGSDSGTNFVITPDGQFWHCWRHGTSGGRGKLERMIRGETNCEEC
jgi:hypothetical protein